MVCDGELIEINKEKMNTVSRPNKGLEIVWKPKYLQPFIYLLNAKMWHLTF